MEKIYEVTAHTTIGVYTEVVYAETAKEAITKAKPRLRELARGYKLYNLRVEVY